MAHFLRKRSWAVPSANVDLLDARKHGLGRAADLGRHAAGDLTGGYERFKRGYFDDALYRIVYFYSGNIRYENQVLRPAFLRDFGSREVCVDIVNIPCASREMGDTTATMPFSLHRSIMVRSIASIRPTNPMSRP